MDKKKIADMTKEDIAQLIDELVFYYDNSTQDIRDFERRDLHNIESDIQWRLHNGKEIRVNITIED